METPPTLPTRATLGDGAAAQPPAGAGPPRGVAQRRRLGLVLALGSVILAFEVVGGVLANSLVLLADAAHYATDLLSVALAMAAITWAMKPADERRTFGYHRAEVVAAFVQALALWAVSAYLLWESWKRLRDPPEVDAPILLAVGGITLVANAGLALTLRRHSGHDLNVRAAYLHIVSDVLGSAAALLAGLAIQVWGFHAADPLLTIAITLLIVAFTVRLTRQTLHILLEGAPPHADPEQVRAELHAIAGVEDVHDLHVWTLTSGVDSVSAHVVAPGAPLAGGEAIVRDAERRLADRFGIDHVTLQVEGRDRPCASRKHR